MNEMQQDDVIDLMNKLQTLEDAAWIVARDARKILGIMMVEWTKISRRSGVSATWSHHGTLYNLKSLRNVMK